jgi:hypothetical protein
VEIRFGPKYRTRAYECAGSPDTDRAISQFHDWHITQLAEAQDRALLAELAEEFGEGV